MRNAFFVTLRGWQFITYIQVEDFMSNKGYTFFMAILYIVVVTLFIALGLCVQVGYSFQMNRFDFVWWVHCISYYKEYM